MNKNKNKKSPLKNRPLRYVAQSLDEDIEKLINDESLPYFVVCIFLVYFSAWEWWRFFKNPPPTPKTLTVISIIFIFFAVKKIKENFKKVKQLKLGRDGERAVGQFLEHLRAQGHRVFHDIICDSFNLDHVVVSRKGIFVIETKTYSKPEKGEAIINFDGEKLIIDGYSTDDKLLNQVRASSKWLKSNLLTTTGKEFPIRPVILFPGWYVEPSGEGKKSDIWVLNPKALPKFIENQKDTMEVPDMMLISYHLSRYIRMKEREP